jgi:hypothetical protein
MIAVTFSPEPMPSELSRPVPLMPPLAALPVAEVDDVEVLDVTALSPDPVLEMLLMEASQNRTLVHCGVIRRHHQVAGKNHAMRSFYLPLEWDF